MSYCSPSELSGEEIRNSHDTNISCRVLSDKPNSDAESAVSPDIKCSVILLKPSETQDSGKDGAKAPQLSMEVALSSDKIHKTTIFKTLSFKQTCLIDKTQIRRSLKLSQMTVLGKFPACGSSRDEWTLKVYWTELSKNWDLRQLDSITEPTREKKTTEKHGGVLESP